MPMISMGAPDGVLELKKEVDKWLPPSLSPKQFSTDNHMQMKIQFPPRGFTKETNYS